MSHVYGIETEFNDIDALKGACGEMGLTFAENQNTYQWYGKHVGDYPLPEGVTSADLGKSEHAIKVPGTSWEIGVVRVKGKDSFRLVFDFWGTSGNPILQAIASNDDLAALNAAKKVTHHVQKEEAEAAKGKRLIQLYGIHKITKEAERRGLRVVRDVQPGGAIKLKITGAALMGRAS